MNRIEPTTPEGRKTEGTKKEKRREGTMVAEWDIAEHSCDQFPGVKKERMKARGNTERREKRTVAPCHITAILEASDSDSY